MKKFEDSKQGKGISPKKLANISPDPHSRQGRIVLATMVMKLFEHWKLPPEDQLAFLGLSTRARRTLNRFRKGEPLPDNRDLMDRVGNLLAIHSALRILFSHNREIVYQWVTSPNADFGGRAPAETIREKGFLGLLAVRNYLDYETQR